MCTLSDQIRFIALCSHRETITVLVYHNVHAIRLMTSDLVHCFHISDSGCLSAVALWCPYHQTMTFPSHTLLTLTATVFQCTTRTAAGSMGPMAAQPLTACLPAPDRPWAWHAPTAARTSLSLQKRWIWGVESSLDGHWRIQWNPG